MAVAEQEVSTGLMLGWVAPVEVCQGRMAVGVRPHPGLAVAKVMAELLGDPTVVQQGRPATSEWVAAAVQATSPVVAGVAVAISVGVAAVLTPTPVVSTEAAVVAARVMQYRAKPGQFNMPLVKEQAAVMPC